MVNLSWALAEAYAKVNQNVRVEISGGGAGIGVAALINGTCDIADSARKLLPEEIEKAQAKLGRDLQEFPIGYDALIVCVHRDNPLEQISIAQLAQIYREGGRIDKWSDLGVKMPKNRDNIVRVSRQNNSGSYHFFREILIGKQADFKLGSRAMNSSKEAVELVTQVPAAIGYAAIAWVQPGVKILRISDNDPDKAVSPSRESVCNGSYPFARAMFMYTRAEPPVHVADYIRWVRSLPGQKIVEESGYIPLPEKQLAKLD